VLLTTLSDSRRTGKIFMQNMRVLAMNTVTAKTEDGRPIPATTSTLEVTPEELELLTIAQATGSLQLALRGYGDPDSVRTAGANTNDLERALREGGIRPTSPEPRRAPRNVTSAPRVVPETVIVQRPAEVQKAPAKPDTNKVEVFRGNAKTEQKFIKDSVRRDTIPNN
jgi:pilus assembly protein CpaB